METGLQPQSVTREDRAYLVISRHPESHDVASEDISDRQVYRHLTEAFAHECAHMLDFHRIEAIPIHGQHFDSVIR